MSSSIHVTLQPYDALCVATLCKEINKIADVTLKIIGKSNPTPYICDVNTPSCITKILQLDFAIRYDSVHQNGVREMCNEIIKEMIPLSSISLNPAKGIVWVGNNDANTEMLIICSYNIKFNWPVHILHKFNATIDLICERITQILEETQCWGQL